MATHLRRKLNMMLPIQPAARRIVRQFGVGVFAICAACNMFVGWAFGSEDAIEKQAMGVAIGKQPVWCGVRAAWLVCKAYGRNVPFNDMLLFAQKNATQEGYVSMKTLVDLLGDGGVDAIAIRASDDWLESAPPLSITLHNIVDRAAGRTMSHYIVMPVDELKRVQILIPTDEPRVPVVSVRGVGENALTSASVVSLVCKSTDDNDVFGGRLRFARGEIGIMEFFEIVVKGRPDPLRFGVRIRGRLR